MRARAFARSTDRWKSCGQARGWMARERAGRNRPSNLHWKHRRPRLSAFGASAFSARRGADLSRRSVSGQLLFLLRSAFGTFVHRAFFVEGRGTLVAGALQVNLFFFFEAPSELSFTGPSSSKGPSTLFAGARRVNTFLRSPMAAWCASRWAFASGVRRDGSRSGVTRRPSERRAQRARRRRGR